VSRWQHVRGLGLTWAPSAPSCLAGSSGCAHGAGQNSTTTATQRVATVQGEATPMVCPPTSVCCCVALSCSPWSDSCSVQPQTGLGAQSARNDFGSCAEVRGRAVEAVGVGLVEQHGHEGASGRCPSVMVQLSRAGGVQNRFGELHQR
jgi:hypothetical protein